MISIFWMNTHGYFLPVIVSKFTKEEQGRCRVDIYSTDGRSSCRLLYEGLVAGESIRLLMRQNFLLELTWFNAPAKPGLLSVKRLLC
ncbi:MAG: hypothetical protein KAR40_17295 [Candidatus Sabulitectum sp.]|nr:hypothetical protein [Candidatus Sabulitectum sp.]